MNVFRNRNKARISLHVHIEEETAVVEFDCAAFEVGQEF